MSTAKPRFRFRRQFIMGRSLDAPFPDWQHVTFGPFDVHAHPDVVLTSRSQESVQAVLLGYAFDPTSPHRTNVDIVATLAARDSFSAVLKEISGYAGTFALLYRNASETKLVHDAAGLYEVYYTTGGDLVVGSQPALLRKCAALDEDRSPQASEFFASAGFRKSGYLPAGPNTIYQNVRHLMPNRYLDLESGSPARYWPVTKRIERPRSGIADQVSQWLAGFVEAAGERYTLSIGVTAGLDSRVLVAASRPHRHDIEYFIIPHPKAGSIDRADRRIAPRLANRLGVPLSVRPYGNSVDPDFEAAYEESVTLARKSLMAEWYDVFYRQGSEEMTINGNVSEVARLFYDRTGDLTAEHLARLVYGEALPYAVDAYERWLEETAPLCEQLDYELLDLFYWEERMGNWAAKGRSEMHLVTDVFTPYNCRQLLEMLLSVDASDRQKIDNALYRDIIYRLWPEALEEPINPRLKLRVSKWMRRMHLYAPVMRLVSAFKR